MLNKLLPTFYCATAVKITTVLNINNPSAVNITVENPSTVQVITNVAMSPIAPTVYEYILQSDASWPEGDYTVTVTAFYAGYQSVTQQKFTLIRQE